MKSMIAALLMAVLRSVVGPRAAEDPVALPALPAVPGRL